MTTVGSLTPQTRQRRLTQFVIKPTVFCYHRCPYCDLRQNYYDGIVQDRKNTLKLAAGPGARITNPGHMPRDLALRLVEEAAQAGMQELQLSGGDPLLYPHLLEVITAAKAHPGVFVLMNSVGTGVTVERARAIIEAGLGAWNFSIDTLDPDLYEQLRGVRGALPTILDAFHTVREAGRVFPGFRTNFMSVITRQNFRGLPDVFDYAVAEDVASVYLMNVYGDTTGASLLTISEIEEFRAETVPAILAVLERRGCADVVQRNAADVLATFFSADNTDANYAQGVYWPTMASAKSACHLPDFYALVEPDGRVLPCCMVEISHEGEVGSVVDESLAHVLGGPAHQRFDTDRIPFCQRCPSPRNRTVGLVPHMCRQFRD